MLVNLSVYSAVYLFGGEIIYDFFGDEWFLDSHLQY